jgi:hypothetical protein
VKKNYAWLPCSYSIFYRQFGKLRSFTDLLPFTGTLNQEVMAALPPHSFKSPPACYYNEHRTLDCRTFHYAHTIWYKHGSTDDIWKNAQNKQDPDLHKQVILPARNQSTNTALLCETAKSKCAMFQLYCFCLQQMQVLLSVIMQNRHTHMHKCSHTHTHICICIC